MWTMLRAPHPAWIVPVGGPRSSSRTTATLHLATCICWKWILRKRLTEAHHGLFPPKRCNGDVVVEVSTRLFCGPVPPSGDWPIHQPGVYCRSDSEFELVVACSFIPGHRKKEEVPYADIGFAQVFSENLLSVATTHIHIHTPTILTPWSVLSDYITAATAFLFLLCLTTSQAAVSFVLRLQQYPPTRPAIQSTRRNTKPPG